MSGRKRGPLFVHRVCMTAIVVLLLGTVALYVVDHHWLQAFNTFLLAVAAWTFLATTRRQWRNAYWRGRRDFLFAMAEAQERGITPEDFWRSQLERDMAMYNDRSWP